MDRIYLCDADAVPILRNFVTFHEINLTPLPVQKYSGAFVLEAGIVPRTRKAKMEGSSSKLKNVN